jgi:hypothetical protein
MPADLLEERRLSRSAIRHRPIVPDAINTVIQTPRASRAKKQREPHTTGGPPLVVHKSKGGTWLIYLVLGMLTAMVLLWIGQLLWNWGNTALDDIHYGRPRTTSIDQFVGHETGKTPSHFIAQNLRGQVYVVEIPGGQANQSHLFIGPCLYGPGSDLAPVSLSFVGDTHHPDLLVRVASIQVLFQNTGTTYAPTP